MLVLLLESPKSGDSTGDGGGCGGARVGAGAEFEHLKRLVGKAMRACHQSS